MWRYAILWIVTGLLSINIFAQAQDADSNRSKSIPKTFGAEFFKQHRLALLDSLGDGKAAERLHIIGRISRAGASLIYLEPDPPSIFKKLDHFPRIVILGIKL